MSPERDVVLDITPEDYDAMASPFIEIPIGASGQPKAGDECFFLVEAQANIGEKTPGVSYQVPLMVMEEGVNKGKIVDWYPGYRGQALNIFKRGLEAFDKKDVVEDVVPDIHLLGNTDDANALWLEKILDVLENMPSENLVTVPEPFVPHIREILEKMNKVRGQGPAVAVEIDS